MVALALDDWLLEDALIPWEGTSSSNVLPWLQVDVVRDYGADPTGSVDSTAAFVSAITVVGPHRVLVPRGSYRVESTELLIEQSRVNIIGEGQQTSVVDFVNGGGFHFKLPTAGVIEQCSVRSLSIKSTSTSTSKSAIKGTDVSIFTVDDCAIGPTGSYTGGTAIAPFTGGSSVGIHLRGREQITLSNNTISADIPVWIDGNPNSTIDIDQLHVYDNYLVAAGTNPCVYISTGVNASNCLFDGQKTWAGGGRALYWVDTTSTIASHNFVIAYLRYEQPTARFYVIQIEHNTNLLDCTISNVVFGAGTTMDGIKLRQVRHPIIQTYAYDGTGVALDVDTTAVSVRLDRIFSQDSSTISIGGLILMDAQVRTNALSPNSRYELWIDPANPFVAAGQSKWFQGRWYHNGPVPSARTLANGASAAFETIGGSGTQGSITVRAHGATKHVGITATFDATGAYKVNGTADTDAGPAAVGGKLVVLFGSLASMAIKNDLGESVTYSYELVQW